MKKTTLTIAVLLGLTACLRLDGFVFFSKPVDNLNEDLLSDLTVPAELRQELKTEIVSEDGVAVSAYLLSHKDGDGTEQKRHDYVLIFAHGQASNIKTSRFRLELLWKLGYSVLAFDPRGTGKTQGTPTEMGYYADARATRTYAETRFGADHVGFYGRSLGTLSLTPLAAERAPKVMVLESPPRSIQQIINDSMSVDTPAHWYVDTLMDNLSELPKYTGSLLIMHGTADDYVAPINGDELHDAAEGHASPNVIWRVPGATHGNVPCKGLQKTEGVDGCVQGMSDEYISYVTTACDTAFGIP